MLVQALAEYADTYLADQLEQAAWEEKPVPWLIAIDESGRFLNAIGHHVAAVRGKRTVSVPAPLAVPRSPVPRNAGLYPLLAADDIKYVLGVGSWTPPKQEENNRERFHAFANLIRDAAEETDDAALKAAALFYGRDDQLDAARAALAEAKAGSIIALALGVEPMVKRPAIRACWTRRYNAAATDRLEGGTEGECLICGKNGPVARTHDKIKGLSSLGGQPAGVSLMSFDKEAFRSYGWEQNANSPVSPERAMAYVLALNDLLRRDGGHRRDIVGVGFIFWTRGKGDFDPMLTIDQPDPDDVQRLLSLSPVANPDPNMFYMAGVAGNGGRLIVRYWLAETLVNVKSNVRGWFEGLRIADVYTGTCAGPPPMWKLRQAIEREGEPPADQTIALMRRAIQGPSRPLGYRMLTATLARLRVSSVNRLEPARMGLIRMTLNDIIGSRGKKETPMTENLDAGEKHPAYLCGRLLAVYESLQYTASGDTKVNQTVSDRYYTLASTYPMLAFPRLEDLGNKHLRKIRRDKPGAMVRISQEIDQLHLEIELASEFKFPRALDPEGQGRFALGYHHQRAHQMSQAQAAKALKQNPASEDQENS